jgi:urease accessory protein
MSRFGDAIEGGLAVGSPGKVGVLELTLAPSGGTTRVHRQYQRSPLYVYRPIHLDAGRPDMAFVFVQQSGDGLVQGDRYRVDVHCAARSAVHITTQAATNVFGARQNFAEQLVNLRADAGAVVEYLPDPLVPFRGARLFQRTSITAHPSATVICGETLLPGRVAHGEAHVYDIVCCETELRSPGGRLQFADRLRLDPAGGQDPRSPGALGGHDVVATLYVVTGELAPPAIVSLLRTTLGACPDVLAGASELPADRGAVARILGPSSKAVKRAMRDAWDAVRVALLGVPAPDLRKG